MKGWSARDKWQFDCLVEKASAADLKSGKRRIDLEQNIRAEKRDEMAADAASNGGLC